VATELLAAGALRVDWHGPNGEPVVTVTLARPERRNAQTPATWRALAAVGSALPTGTRVVVLRGDGPSFSAGIDLRAFSPEGIDGETPFTDIALADDATAAAHIAVFQSGFTWLHDRSDIITVAVVRGAAVGAGFQLALACDLRVCADDTRFAMKETSLGLVPDLTGTHPLVDAVGYSRALEICLTGRWVEAAEAAALRIATTVVAGDTLDATAAALVEAILAAPEDAVRATKKVLSHAVASDVGDQRRVEREAQVTLIRGLLPRA
jgi:enoyl-CoA hydratase/carnithine racemase